MTPQQVQAALEQGERQLMQMQYLQAEQTLAEAERDAWNQHDFYALSRVYLPLQESRRQRRQRALDGPIRLDLVAQGAEDHLQANRVIENFRGGTVLVAGWMSLEPAIQTRRLATQQGLYLDVFLGAVYPLNGRRKIWIARRWTDAAPADLASDDFSFDEPIVRISAAELWERLHAQALAEAGAERNPLKQIEAYRKTIQIDYACERAHQNIAFLARDLHRQAQKQK